MKKFILAVCALILIFPVISFYGCGNSKYSRTFYSFNATPVEVVIYGQDFSAELISEIETELDSINQTYSATKDGSIISQINSLDFTQTTLSNEQALVFKSAKNLNEFTSNKFNPAVYPLVKAWSFSPNYPVLDFTPPSQDYITQTLSLDITNFDNFVLDENTATLTKLNPSSQIDLGGIIKGYGADKISNILYSHGITKGYISIGSSSLKTLKMNAVMIKHPEKTTDTIVKINLNKSNDFSISTSGDYERFYTYQGVKYAHIIDTDGKPYSTGIISATVITSSGIDADALSTALCLCEFNPTAENDELRDFISKISLDEKYAGAKIYAVYSKDNVKYLITNEKQGENFTLLDNSFTIFEI